MSVPLLAHSALLGSSLREFAPTAALADVVVCTWEASAGSRDTVNVLPDGCADLMWDGADLWIAGVQAGVVAGRAASPHVVGVRLRPAALDPLIEVPASELPAGRIAATELWGRTAHRWSDRFADAAGPGRARATLEQLVVERLAHRDGPDPRVAAATSRLGEPSTRIDDIAREVGLSARELRRRFHRNVGISPKHLQRVMRFHRFVRSLGPVVDGHTTLARAAVECGYADQPHATRECRELAGRTPRALVATWAMHGRPRCP